MRYERISPNDLSTLRGKSDVVYFMEDPQGEGLLEYVSRNGKLELVSGKSFGEKEINFPVKSFVKPRRVRTLVFGSSSSAHNFIVLSANMSVSNGVATLVIKEGNDQHLLGTGSTVMLILNNPDTEFSDHQVRGTFERTSATTGTVYVGDQWPDGVGKTSIVLETAYGPASWFRDLNSRLGNALELVAPFVAGGEVTERKLEVIDRLLEFDFDLVIGAWGIGNDLLQGVYQNTVQNMKSMVDKVLAKGAYALIELPPCKTGASQTQITESLRISQELRALYQNHPRVILIDMAVHTTIMDTGDGNPDYFVTDGIHYSQYGTNKVVSKVMAEALLEGMLRKPITPWTISSLRDTRILDVTSKQLMAGFWSSTLTKDSATLNIKLSGPVPDSVESISSSGAGPRSFVFSIVDHPEGKGKMLRMTCNWAAGNDLVAITLKGNSTRNEEFWRFTKSLTKYTPACYLAVTHVSGAGIKAYESTILYTVDGVEVRSSDGIRADKAPEIAGLDKSLDPLEWIFPEFQLPSVPTDGKWLFQFQAKGAGVSVIDIALPTLRESM